ncbi:unnamed protein product [Penicillium nalgiovense]|nr:unnamed protein product [Penicillium nalgiovense]
MHKCPPAEACRDAFERMSKATVQMCLSTTGFGSQVDTSRIYATSNTGSSLHPGRLRQPMDQRHRAGQGQSRRATQARPSRPAPKFDMNLADLFNDNTPLADHSRPENRPGGPTYPQPESMAPNFPADQSSRSYGQRNPSMDYYLKYENPNSPQPNPQFYYSNSPQHSGSPGSNTQTHGLPSTDTEAPQGMSLDFLDFGSGDAEGQGNMEGEANPDYNMMGVPSLGHNLGQNVGIDLGFGMAMDFQHDWSENPNYDLLEGYFFGGSGAGAPGDV